MTAPVGANRTFNCSGNGVIVWVVGEVQVRTEGRKVIVGNRGVYPIIGQQNFSQVVMMASVALNMSSFRLLVCRVETGDIFSGSSSVESEQVSLLVYGE